MKDPNAYWLDLGQGWRLVSRQKFIAAEREAGYEAKEGELATHGFMKGKGGLVLKGRITGGPMDIPQFSGESTFCRMALKVHSKRK
jgi:hypothetical protein